MYTQRGTAADVATEPNLNGVVNTVTVRSQILYEIQGDVYLNPDVQALIDNIKVTGLDKDRVLVSGVRGIAPPDTTKAAICGVAGYQAETMVFATGLDIDGMLRQCVALVDACRKV